MTVMKVAFLRRNPAPRPPAFGHAALHAASETTATTAASFSGQRRHRRFSLPRLGIMAACLRLSSASFGWSTQHLARKMLPVLDHSAARAVAGQHGTRHSMPVPEDAYDGSGVFSGEARHVASQPSTRQHSMAPPVKAALSTSCCCLRTTATTAASFSGEARHHAHWLSATQHFMLLLRTTATTAASFSGEARQHAHWSSTRQR